MSVCPRFQHTTLLLVPLLFELVLVAGMIGFDKAAHIPYLTLPYLTKAAHMQHVKLSLHLLSTGRKTTRPIPRQKEGIKGLRDLRGKMAPRLPRSLQELKLHEQCHGPTNQPYDQAGVNPNL